MGCQVSKDAQQPAAAGAAGAAEKPTVAQRFPYKVDLEKGKQYYWCTCGNSKNQPFCDGSH